MGDFNAEPADIVVADFCEIYNLKNVIREKARFKKPNNPCCIDLIITNRQKSFPNSMVIEVALSDFHKNKNLLLFIIVNLRISIMILS